jgi:hypothetical protein
MAGVPQAAVRTWTCQRQTNGETCRHVNPARYQVCRKCAKRKPPRRRPAHLKALELPYEEYVALNGGEHCGICGAKPSENRRLDRDHEHRGDGKPRGLLCWKCNKALDDRVSPGWLRAAAYYLERAA